VILEAGSPRRYPRWCATGFEVDLREVAPKLFVGGQQAILLRSPMKWAAAIDLFGSPNGSERTRLDVRRDAAFGGVPVTLRWPFLDGQVIPPGCLEASYVVFRMAERHGSVLVSCQAGLSRSASVAYGLLRRGFGLDHAEALRRVSVTTEPGFPREETLASARAWARKR